MAAKRKCSGTNKKCILCYLCRSSNSAHVAVELDSSFDSGKQRESGFNCAWQDTFSIVNFILPLDLLNIVNIFINIASYDHDMIKVMH